jgi:exodeoxyribonuclease-5
MVLTQGQEAALAMARRMTEFKDAPFIGVLAGYAGTGKTTTLKYVAEELGYPICIAPTGKAAVRVREATGLVAKTIHSWLYDSKENTETGEVTYSRKDPKDMDTGDKLPLIVIDEASMVGEDLWDDIYDACCVIKHNILVVGDPFQLPPVEKQRGDDLIERREFNLLSSHFEHTQRVLLTEVMRQALESPIIRASMMVRRGQTTEAVFELPRIRVGDLVTKSAEIVAQRGVVICHKNDTRNKMNVAVRRHLQLPDGEIVRGEPLLILQNNYRTNRFNGETMVFDHWQEEPGASHVINDWIRKQKVESRFGVAVCDYDPDSDQSIKTVLAVSQVFGLLENVHKVPIHKTARVLFGGDGLVDGVDLASLTATQREALLGFPMMHTNFGYVSTAHKAQGSEWDHVMVVVEPTVRLRKTEGLRWLYTALTRAKTNVTVCLGARV